jgi:hypothetical protein
VSICFLSRLDPGPDPPRQNNSMRAQSQLLVKGAQFIAVLTVGSGFVKHQTKTSQISSDDIIHLDPVKDVVERLQSLTSPTMLHFPPAGFAPRRSQTISSITSTITIKSFLIKRGLAHNFFKETPEAWPDDAFIHEACPPSEDQGLSRTPLDGLEPRFGGMGDLSAHFDDFGDSILEDVGGEGALRVEDREVKREVDFENEGWSLALEFPVHRLPWQLHQQAIGLFAELSFFLPLSRELRDYGNDLRDELARLFLWGESFSDGRLDDILADSTELRGVILELCATICKILIEGMSECLTMQIPITRAHKINLKVVVPSLRDLDLSVAERIHHVVGLISQAERAGEEQIGIPCNIHPEDTDVEAFQSSEKKSMSVEDAVHILRSSVDCLMRLLPTMERTLEFG